jgi:hypothetical protein
MKQRYRQRLSRIVWCSLLLLFLLFLTQNNPPHKNKQSDSLSELKKSHAQVILR